MGRLSLRGLDTTGADATNDTPRFNPNSGNLEYAPGGGGTSGGVQSVVAGTGISVDNTDPANPVVSATGGGATVNKFLHCGYTTTPAPSASYPDTSSTVYVSGTGSSTYTQQNGDSGEMTNGRFGAAVYSDSEHVGFINTATIVHRVDAGAAVSGDSLQVHGFGGANGIWLPSGIKVETSDDDATWTTVEDRSGLPQGTGSDGARLWRLDVDVSGAGAHRYWRVTTKTVQTSSYFVFMDEIELW